MLSKVAIIKKVGPKKWCLYSKKKNPKTGKRKSLGCYDSLDAVKKRERQVQYFKHIKGTLKSLVKEATSLGLEEIALELRLIHGELKEG